MNKLKLYSNDKNIIEQLKELEKNKKTYDRLLEGLTLLGKLENKVEIELYETIKNDTDDKTIVYCTDQNSDLLMFYVNSNDKNDYLRIIKVTYDGEKQYDLALAKKFELNEENIELTRTSKVYGFKCGRLITDEKSFYTIFLSDNNAYKIELEESSKKIKASEVLTALNNLEEEPNLMNYIDIFAKQKITFKFAKTEAYKDFKNIGRYVIGGNQEEKQKIN